MTTTKRRVALVTGGSAGLGLELVRALAHDGWTVITDAREPSRLAAAARGIEGDVVTVPGDVTDAGHRASLLGEVRDRGRLDLLVQNASTLGPTPRRHLDAMAVSDLAQVWRTNLGAPLLLTGELLPTLIASGGVLLSISSDAAVEHYPGWGLYGASKAALDHVTLTFAEENPGLTAYAVDPGDMRTAMQQAAFPGEDISDRPLPGTVVPHLLALLARRPASGRYRASDIAIEQEVVA